MNFLAHLYLSGDDPELMVGNLMGDFVKGRLAPGQYPAGVQRGIVLHRRIDSAAGRSEFFQRSRLRLDQRFGLYRAVLVDLFYDHFLAVDWHSYSPVPLDSFLSEGYRRLQARQALLPERLRKILPTIFTELLPSYREVAGIERALQRMAGRIGRPSPLADGAAELLAHYAPLRDDFCRFLPAIESEVATLLAGTSLDR